MIFFHCWQVVPWILSPSEPLSDPLFFLIVLHQPKKERGVKEMGSWAYCFPLILFLHNFTLSYRESDSQSAVLICRHKAFPGQSRPVAR